MLEVFIEEAIKASKGIFKKYKVEKSFEEFDPSIKTLDMYRKAGDERVALIYSQKELNELPHRPLPLTPLEQSIKNAPLYNEYEGNFEAGEPVYKKLPMPKSKKVLHRFGKKKL
ncbi:hypothetical protein EIN_333780 [Entamoeba invadens IP1]|uniref:Uncharacterized protein n=1 Tax=Entamoeba invadens IP1 TaxID=370355 RepID=A0A0A1UB58_ENTIV|nr:hypothetical protein EIN_333780 [Entamoeba invadens IP1]ELP92421.1 hypothetical protein EIN_333780 [Entamoeba invadens IP1]|eukprot:XP_004259192.1 hypothetical protein EIN_333780 [Entamoeba invadens IP1]